MLSVWTWMQSRLATDEEGASLVEYALLLVLIAVVAIVALRALGDTVDETFVTVVEELGGTVPE